MSNLEIYDAVRKVPDEAKREIVGGKLKGKTDINPMWRIKTLTAQFGPAGKGWITENEHYSTLPGANGEVAVMCELHLRYYTQGEWSGPVFGVGGSMLIQIEKGKLVTNDEAYKMAYTDAISVACKALGFAADVYWDRDPTKYSITDDAAVFCPICKSEIAPIELENGAEISPLAIVGMYGKCPSCKKREVADRKANRQINNSSGDEPECP